MPCDTASVRTARHVYFLKNSDRHPNEEQLVEYCMRADPSTQPEVKCTYITIPEPSTKLSRKLGNLRPLCIISRPVHMWGAEMAVNEYGLAIGNEAIFSTRVPVPEGPSYLTGMDLVRLAIERCATAEAAVALIGSLLQRHGQGGNCGYADLKMFYHNGFILTDPTKTYLMLSFGSHWLAVESSSISDFPLYEFPISQTGKSGSLTSPTDFVLDEVANETTPGPTAKVSPLAQAALEKGKEVSDVVTTLSNAIPESLNWGSVSQSSPGFEDFLLGNGWITQSQKDSKLFSVRKALLGVWGYHKLCDQFGCGRQRQGRTEKLLNSIFCDGEVEEPSVSLAISPNAHSQDALGGRSPAHSCTLNLSTTSGSIDSAGFEARRALACFDVLRDHGDLRGEQLATSVYGANVCMHSGAGPIRINSTTASLVVILQAGPPPVETEFGLSFDRKPVHVFSTCTSTPCLSIFKPLSFEVGRRYLGLPSVESLDEVAATGAELSEEEDEFSEKPIRRKVSLPKGSFTCSVIPPSAAATRSISVKETFWRRAEAVFRLLSLNWKVTRSLRGSCVYAVERELILNYFGVSSRSPGRARSPSLAVRVSPSTTPTTSSLAALQLGNSRARRESISALTLASSPAEDLQRTLDFQESAFSVHERVLERLQAEFEKENAEPTTPAPTNGLQSLWAAVFRPRSWKSIMLYVYSTQIQRWSRQMGLPLPSSYGSLLQRRKEDAAVSAVAWVSLAACALLLITRLRRGRTNLPGGGVQQPAASTAASSIGKPRPPPLLYFVPNPE